MSEDDPFNLKPNDDNPEDTSATPIMKSSGGRKLRSKVWIDFARQKALDGSLIAICNHSNKTLTAKSTSGTTHLKNHLNSCDRYKKKKMKTVDITQRFLNMGDKRTDGTAKINCIEFNQQRSRDDLAKMVLFHEYPFSMIDHHLFRQFVKNLQPLFKLNTRNTLRSDTLKLHQQEKDKLYKLLDNLPCRVSLTSDLWTSKKKTQGFLSLTCHYIDNEWNLRKKILNFALIESPHTADRIQKLIIDKLYSWNLDNKILSIVLDNCTTNDALSREMMISLRSKRALLSNGELFHARCCAHVLNIVVQDGLVALRDVITNVRESVKYIKGSQGRIERFKRIAEQVRAPKTYLFSDVPTRWNSTFLMLEIALKFSDAFSRLAECDTDYKYAPSLEDWENAKVMIECLRIFYNVTLRISGSKYPTSNLYFNDCCDIYIALKNWSSNGNRFVSNMASRMLQKFEKYWKMTNIILAIASVLDPRYKLKSVEYYFGVLYSRNDADHNIHNIKSYIDKLFVEYGSQISDGTSENPSPNFMSQQLLSSKTTQPPYVTSRAGLAKFIQESSLSKPQRSEFDIYLDEPVHPGMEDENFDILTWWKCNAPKYPVLGRMARDILSIPVSTVASEAAFSTGGRILDEYRSRLTPGVVEVLVCTQDWLRDQINEDSSKNGFAEATSTIFSALEFDSEIYGCSIDLS